MSRHSKKNNKKPMYESLSDDGSSDVEIKRQPIENTDSDDSVIEMTERDKKKRDKKTEKLKQNVLVEKNEKVVKKPVSELKLQSIRKAQQARQEQLKQKRLDDEENKKLIEKSYRKEVEVGLQKTLLPKYEKKIKKNCWRN